MRCHVTAEPLAAEHSRAQVKDVERYSVPEAYDDPENKKGRKHRCVYVLECACACVRVQFVLWAAPRLLPRAKDSACTIPLARAAAITLHCLRQPRAAVLAKRTL